MITVGFAVTKYADRNVVRQYVTELLYLATSVLRTIMHRSHPINSF